MNTENLYRYWVYSWSGYYPDVDNVYGKYTSEAEALECAQKLLNTLAAFDYIKVIDALPMFTEGKKFDECPTLLYVKS